jgi:acetyltransferase-like isoleucine patch superfamily enzyme
VNIHDNNSHPVDHDLRHRQYRQIIGIGHPSSELNLNEKAILIEDDVWIGYNASILKGVRIGRGAIIAACAVVTKDVESFTVVAGNPAVKIKQL